jgi:hypothetical protein
MLPPAIFRSAQFRAANAVTFVINGALGGFAFVFSDGVIGILITIMPWRFP